MAKAGDFRERSTVSAPAQRNSQTISRSVQAVESAMTAKIAHSTAARPEGQSCELQRRAGDDADDGSPDAIEKGLHPGKASESDVRGGDTPDHEKRGEHEENGDDRGSGDSAAHIPEIHGELRGERSGSELREREAVDVVLSRDPPALLHQIALHEPRERDGASEPGGAETQEIGVEAPRAHRRIRHRGHRFRPRFGAGRRGAVGRAACWNPRYSASNRRIPWERSASSSS